MPYPGVCDRIGPDYRKLVGANLVEGFRKRLHDTIGGIQGCTHITELLGYLPTAAVQTFAGLRKREDEGAGKPFQLDRCHALETTTDNRAPLLSASGIAARHDRDARRRRKPREDPRIPGQGAVPQVRHAGAARHSRVHRRRGGAGREAARRSGVGREGADPRRRPRQGRRRQARASSIDEVRDAAPARSSACSSSRTRPGPAGRRCAGC